MTFRFASSWILVPENAEWICVQSPRGEFPGEDPEIPGPFVWLAIKTRGIGTEKLREAINKSSDLYTAMYARQSDQWVRVFEAPR